MKMLFTDMKPLIITALVMIMSGCIHTNNVLEIFDKNDTNVEFRGVLDVIKNTDKNVNILFVHGMGGYSQTDGVSDPCKVAQDIERGLGIKQKISKDNKNDALYCLGTFEYEGQKILFQSNQWGYLTSYTKRRLRENDHDPKIVKHRSKTTTYIKDYLFNDGFADAVMYTGEAKQAIKDNVARSIELINSSNDNTITIIITFSLGSKIVVDTVNDMHAKGKLGSLANSVEMIYLMANQIPLINIGDGRVFYPDKADKITTKLTEEYERFNLLLTPTKITSLANERIKIVAFTDPNDLLSYTLNSKTMGSLKDSYVNVGISVATNTYYIPFKKEYGVVNYVTAHTGYVHNDKVRDLLMNGNKVTK
jgi:hypothetical protein